MNTYIAILRGINVSGQKKILMSDLKDLFTSLGIEKVETYIQSGNVVFSMPEKVDCQEFSQRIEAAIFDKYQFQVPVIMRSKEEWDNAITNNPLRAKEGIDIEKLHITFLSDLPDPNRLELISPYQYLPDEFCILGKEVYLYCPVDYGHSKLSNNFFESKLKVKATTRNWKTVLKLQEIASQIL
ncbi:MAG: DUF1697 domain-containing protein [Cytophagales bacterium]|nr:DUF1697 domain-containing protein [Cytophagales bacterium]